MIVEGRFRGGFLIKLDCSTANDHHDQYCHTPRPILPGGATRPETSPPNHFSQLPDL